MNNLMNLLEDKNIMVYILYEQINELEYNGSYIV